jgi:hypothetical protein
VLPLWVMVQVVLFIMETVKPAPIIEPVESDVLPAHEPVIVGVWLGPVTDGPVPAHAAVLNAAARLMTPKIRMAKRPSLRPPEEGTLMCLLGEQLLCH